MPLPKPLRNRVSFLVVFVLAFDFAGCAKPSAYKSPVGKFRDAASVVIQSTKVYLLELNKVERDQYIYGQAGKPGQIQLNHIEEVQVFSKEGIAARLNALDQLADYTELLYELTNSSAPETVKTRASDLQTTLTNLSDQIKNLTGENDKVFKSTAGKILPGIGDVLQAFVEQSLENALKKAIKKGEGPVNELIEAIESDAAAAYQRKRTAYSGARVILIDQYNREFEKADGADPAKLKAYADAISVGEDRWEAFLSAQPNDGLEAMKKANTALVKFAKTPKPNINDFASFAEAMDSFANTASRVGKLIQELTAK